jgi:hypothetical protein
MDARRLRSFAPWLAAAAALAAGLAIGWTMRAAPAPVAAAPDAQAAADAALLSVREQGRLVSYSARFVSVVTASQSRLGLTARKTLILPGMVRYGVDLARLRRSNLAWDAPTRTLTVTLPPLEISGPSVDMDQVREFSEGGLAMALTNAEESLDEENRRHAREDLARQARAPAVLAEAREAVMRIVARGFAAPLRAAGIDASVAVRFVDPAGAEMASFLDRPRRTEDAIEERRAGLPAHGEDETR